MAVAVPRGNRQAILMNVTRAEFGGPVGLALDGLPAGVSVEAEPVPPGVDTVPVLFTASAGAPLMGTLARVSGRSLDPKLAVPSEFGSVAELVLGQNNVPFWTRNVDALAVAVTEEAPFAVEVVEPKVPLVRGGAMELKVVARRKPGFTAPIAVALPWNPPGVSSKREVVIPEGKDQATILLNAGAGAPLNTWKIVVNGTYTEVPPGPPPPRGAGRGRGRGRLIVSSPLARLTIKPAFLGLKFAAVSVEQGGAVDLPATVTRTADFQGEARATLLGLPNKVTAEPVTITKDSDRVVFHLTTDGTSPPGETKGLVCQVVLTQDGEPIVHNLGGGRLRIDRPLPASPGKPAAVKATLTSSPASPSPARPLSRLEKLRLESKDRARPPSR
jgi:hypothetical protein